MRPSARVLQQNNRALPCRQDIKTQGLLTSTQLDFDRINEPSDIPLRATAGHRGADPDWRLNVKVLTAGFDAGPPNCLYLVQFGG